MTGSMTITGATGTTTVDATNSSSVSVAGTGTANVNAGANTTSVTTNGFETATIDAGTATAINITDAGETTDVTTVATNANATITNSTTGKLVVDIADGKTITANAIGASLEVTGSGDVTVSSTGSTTETITNSKTDGTLTVTTSTTASQDLTKIDADLIKLTGDVGTGGAGAGVISVADKANLEVTAATTLIDLTGKAAAKSESATVTFTGLAPTATNITLSSIETLNLVAAATEGTGTDFTVTTLDLDTASNKVVVSGSNDISLGNITGTGSVDASAVTGEVKLTQAAGGGALTLTGSATAKNTVEFTGAAVASSYTGGEGNDTVTFKNTAGSGVASATAVVGNGINVVKANSLTTGDLVVIAGSGNDTVEATALTAGVVNVQLGDGTNSLTIGNADGTDFSGVNVTYIGGAGNDTLTINEDVTATDKIVANLGNGTNVVDLQGTSTGAATYDLVGGTGVDTLKVAAGTDLSGAKLTLTDFDIIQIASAGTITFDASDISGKSYEIKGNTSASDILAVTASTAAGDTVDLSSLVMNQTITAAVSKTSITTGNGNDTIIGTAVADTVIAGNGTNSISTGAGNDDITGGTGNDTITAGTGNDTITAGTGADKINLSTGSDIVNQAKDDSAAIGTITAVGANLADSDTIATAVDVITGFTTGTDKINLDGTFTSLVNLQAATATAGTLGLTDGQAGFLVGNYVAATGVFTVDSNPTINGTESILFLYDADATVGVTDIEAMVLVGVTSMVVGDLA